MTNQPNSFELTTEDTQMAKGLAILAMVALHLFCRLDNLPYQPLIFVGSTPLVYYLGLFGDMCVSIYCFCSGYAHYLLYKENHCIYKKRIPVKALRFLTNYWIIVLLFSGLGLVFDDTNTIPGSLADFLGNFLLFHQSYNGAWWFVITYLILLLSSPFIAFFIQRIPAAPMLLVSGAIYCISYLFRYVFSWDIQNVIVQWFWTQLILFGTSQFAYIVGMIFRKYRFISKLRNVRTSRYHTHFIVSIYLIPILLFLIHCQIQTVAIAPITGILTLVCFFLWEKPRWIRRFFLFMGKHSTNILLCHMFFYAVLFKDFVFIARYPILIYIMMLLVCIGVSYIVFELTKLLRIKEK